MRSPREGGGDPVCILGAFQYLEIRVWTDEETTRETEEQPVGQEGHLESVQSHENQEEKAL